MSQLILTVACPEAARPKGTHMGIVHGWIAGQQPSEWENAFRSQYQDDQGNVYRVFSIPVPLVVISRMVASLALSVLPRPPMDVPDENGNYLINMDEANDGHNMLKGNVWQPATPDPETGEMPLNPVPQVASDKIVAVVGMKGTDAVAAMGLQDIPVEI